MPRDQGTSANFVVVDFVVGTADKSKSFQKISSTAKAPGIKALCPLDQFQFKGVFGSTVWIKSNLVASMAME